MITKSPTNDVFKKNICFTNSARTAFSKILNIIEFKDEDTLLIPAYIGYTDREGSGVLDPIKENNIKYDFYPILEDMMIDLNILEKIINKKSIKAILLIHYFGFLHCDIEKLKEMCLKNNILLIEDCAHTLYSKYNNITLGEIGDFSFYSIHKVLPVDTGGFLKINNKNYSMEKIELLNHQKINIECLECLCMYDTNLAIKSIRDNYAFMVSQLNDIKGIKVLNPVLEDGIVPMNLPVFIESMPREEFYFKMIEKDIVLIALYYRLIDTIDQGIYKTSYDISNKIINFPINQDITKDEMLQIILCANEILKNG